jgi:DGQHR domain-containing protein
MWLVGHAETEWGVRSAYNGCRQWTAEVPRNHGDFWGQGRSMPQVLSGLISGDALKPVYAVKSKTVDEKTVAASSEDALLQKIAAEEADGWRVLRRNVKSARLAKDKPIDRQLEDDVWSLLYRMGFKELNFDRNFSIQVNEDTPPRQLDVFAKDDETVFIVECTHSREVGPKSVKALLDKIGAVRPDVIKVVQKHYGREKKLKIKFAIATRNIEWRAADRSLAESTGIPIITEDDLKYFNRLTSILKTAARYQFLGRYFEGEKVEGLRAKVPAARGSMGKKTFYNFLISPHDLLRISYISHMRRASNDDLDTYQRMVKPTRLASIGRYIDGGGTFPTNIVINFKRDNLQFDPKEKFGDTATGILSLPGQYGSAWVIDGQHRLYGYAYASRGPEEDSSVVSVLAYENLPVRDEIELFVDINTRQVKVNSNLVNEIVSSLNVDDPDAGKRLGALCARVALRLDNYPSSPIKDRVLTVAQDKNHSRCLTLTSLSDGIAENNLIGTLHKVTKGSGSLILAGPLAEPSVDSKLTMNRATEGLSLYYGLFANGLENHWALGDDKGGYLATNLGLRAITQLLRRLIVFIERKDDVRVTTIDPVDLVERLKPYIDPIIEYFKTADPNDVARFRNRGSSLQSVDQNCMQMMAIIHAAKSDFDPPEVRDWIQNQDAQGTTQAREMINDITGILFNDVLARLKEKFGADEKFWWLQGIPASVRNECDKRYNDSAGEHERWRYLDLINYSDIILYQTNWELFKNHYNFYGKGKKADLVRWISKVNKARQVTHHAEKGPLSRDQVDFVRRVYSLVKEYIEQRKAVILNQQYLPD